MATLTNITIKKELRLCKVGDEFGYFHCWEQHADVIPPKGQDSRVFGIVEFCSRIERVDPSNIQFVDEDNQYLRALSNLEANNDQSIQ